MKERHSAAGLLLVPLLAGLAPGLLGAGGCVQDAKTVAGCRTQEVGVRTYPSVFQAWNPVENLSGMTEVEALARHDLVFAGPWVLRLLWASTSEQPWSGLSTNLVGVDATRAVPVANGLEQARRRRAELRKLNPNLKLLCELRYREGFYARPTDKPDLRAQDAFPPDSPFWLRDKQGQLCPGWGEDANGDGTITRDEVRFMLLDFRNPAFQALLAQKARAIQQTGLFDGIMLDWWNEDDATTGHWPDWKGTYLTRDEERAARIAMLQAIRREVRDDFLILVNANSRTVPLSAPYVNGLFMECFKKKYDQGYTRDQIVAMEKTLSWAERTLRQPHINCLEGWRVVTAYNGDRAQRVAERSREENRACMRLVTTLSLTHSDGYVLFGDDNAMPSPDHLHNWYDFWDADLGTPVGVAGAEGRVPGLFVREYTGGWAVCNRSGKAQAVSVGVPTRAVSSGKVAPEHIVPDLDGEILLRMNRGAGGAGSHSP
jgi:hypothetical protein